MSIAVPLYGFGAGGAGLNFSIKAYAAMDALLADTPKENTIGIITDTAITSWVFSASEPADPVDGMVWIQTGTYSDVEFNAMKKNAILIYPLYVRQYVSGSWAVPVAKIFQAGAWLDVWNGYLYNNGDECIGITGGWTSSGDTLTKNPDSLYLKGSGVYCYTENGIRTLGYATAVFEAISQSTSVNGKSYVGFLDDSGTEVAKVQVTPGSEKTVVQVPLDAVQGTFKPYLWTQAYNQGAYLYSVYLTI